MDMQKLREKKGRGLSGFTLIELMIVIAIIGILAAVAIPNFLQARAKAQFTGCFEQLSHIKSGLEQYETENNTLAGVGAKGEEVCNLILGGYTTAPACNGKVAPRVDASCAPGTYNITVVDATKGTYEITGTAPDRTSCTICITEVGASPKVYSGCPGACGSDNALH